MRSKLTYLSLSISTLVLAAAGFFLLPATAGQESSRAQCQKNCTDQYQQCRRAANANQEQCRQAFDACKETCKNADGNTNGNTNANTNTNTNTNTNGNVNGNTNGNTNGNDNQPGGRRGRNPDPGTPRGPVNRNTNNSNR